MINDELLNQLMKSEEKKHVFERLMVMIFQFFKEKKKQNQQQNY